MWEQLKNCTSSIAGSKNYAKVIRFGNEKQKAFVVNSGKSIQERIAIIAKETIPTKMLEEDKTALEPIEEPGHQATNQEYKFVEI